MYHRWFLFSPPSHLAAKIVQGTFIALEHLFGFAAVLASAAEASLPVLQHRERIVDNVFQVSKMFPWYGYVLWNPRRSITSAEVVLELHQITSGEHSHQVQEFQCCCCLRLAPTNEVKLIIPDFCSPRAQGGAQV